MQRLGFIIYHSVAQCRDCASLHIILSLYAETGLHYISFGRLCRDWSSLYIILLLYAETGLHYISFCCSMQRLGFIIILPSIQSLGFIIYHSVALCKDWASLYIIVWLYAETGLQYISFCCSMQRLGFIIYNSVAL